jgi:RND family efflux transporter MFP subunit
MRSEPTVPRPAAALALTLAWALVPGLAHAQPAAGHACLIEPFQRVELRSAVEGRIAAIHVDRGDDVRRGQVLVELESAAERASLEGARFRAVMEGEVQSALSRVQAARERLERREALVNERFIAPQERDDSRTELQQAESELLQARDNRRLAEIEVQRLTELLEQRRLRSPVNGVVIERLQNVGEIAQTGETARAILRLAQTHPLRVEVVLPVAMLGQVRVGQRLQVQAEAPLAGSYSAVVTVVDRVVDAASGTFGVRAELPNPRGEIPAGIKCRARLPGAGGS